MAAAKPAARATVVGAGPNGLAAAVALARAGVKVTLIEAKDTIGGGSRTMELTLPGFHHDVCSAIHPLAASSPFFNSLPLAEHGLSWVRPPIELAHPFDDGTAAVLYRSLDDTARDLGRDGVAYARLMRPLVREWPKLTTSILGPVLRPPSHPLLMARFGLNAMQPASMFVRRAFKDESTRGLFAGLAAHATLPLERPFTATFGLVLGAAAHAVGWPIAAGGSQSIADALASYLRALGGEIVTGQRVGNLSELGQTDYVLLDLTPHQVIEVAGDRLSSGYRRQLGRYRYGPGVFKVDYALDGPIPWTAPACREAGTLHLGPTMADISEAEAAVAKGQTPRTPYVLVAQQSLFDPMRAPAGKHTAWAYCHVPAGSDLDMTAGIEAQIERFAPGFKQRILARHTFSAPEMASYNENYVNGDIAGGSHGGLQLFFRPIAKLNPYATSANGLYICSSSTPPGAGVHGMCGYYAAREALKHT